MSLLPRVDIAIVPEETATSLGSQRVLLIGDAPIAQPSVFVDNAQLLSDAQIAAAFGESQLALMLRRYKATNIQSRVDALPLARVGSGTEATTTLTMTLPDTVSALTKGQAIAVVIGGRRIDINLSTGDNLAGVCSKIVTAINSTNLPVVAAAASPVVTVTFKIPGVQGSAVGLSVINSDEVYGKVAAGAAGVGDTDFDGLATLLEGRRYQTIVTGAIGTTGADAVLSILNSRFNADGQVMDGVLVRYLQSSSPANLLTALGSRDSTSEVVIVDRVFSRTQPAAVSLPAGFGQNPVVSIGPAAAIWPEELTAQFGAIRALRLTKDANIAGLVSASTGALDAFGGPAIASLPYFNTPLSGIAPIALGEEFSGTDGRSVAAAGGTITYNNQAGTGVQLGDARTTSKTINGTPDDTFAPLNHVDTASTVREFFQVSLSARFKQSRLTLGDVEPGRNMANAQIIAANLDGYYKTLSTGEYVLTQSGEQALQYFRRNRSVNLNLRTGTASVQMTTPIVTQLRAILVTMKVGFRIQ